MGNILDRFGIKEVADVTFYEIDEATSEAGNPVLFLDTLKVSTIEQTAEQAEARGGKGNSPLIIWDYGKEINVTLEDALFSAKSMALMFGDGTTDIVSEILKTIPSGNLRGTKEDYTFEVLGNTYNLNKMRNVKYYKYAEDGKVINEVGGTPEKAAFDYVTFKMPVSGAKIEISANTFPGTYYVTGDTYARSEKTGKDESFQFIIHKAKVQSENTITLEAEGDPSVFNMSLRVMRPANGVMMELVQYGTTTTEIKPELIKTAPALKTSPTLTTVGTIAVLEPNYADQTPRRVKWTNKTPEIFDLDVINNGEYATVKRLKEGAGTIEYVGNDGTPVVFTHTTGK